MRKTNRKYEVRPLGCDWALDIPLGDTTVVLYFNSRNNAELVKDVLEWEDNHPNEAAPYQPTLTPPNEPLTLDELREMDGEPVYVVFRPDGSGVRSQSWALVNVDEKYGEVYLVDSIPGASCYYDEIWANLEGIYRRPPERQEDTHDGD